MKRRLMFAIPLVIAQFQMANAQTTSIHATGLNFPMKLAVTPDGNLLVSEATATINTGRISIIDSSGARRSLLEGLPSGATFNSSVLGPAGMVLDGRTLYVGILEGNLLVPGPSMGTVAPNPGGPGSPIFSSILRVRLSADVDRIQSAFTLSLDEQFTLADGAEVVLTNSGGQTATLDVLADFPDYPLDRREIFGHVTPYGLTLDPDRRFLYVVDAGQNRLFRVDVNTGRYITLVRFPRVPRVPPTPTLTDTDSVPTSARFFGTEVLVTFLSGAPFAENSAMVRAVNPATREIRPFINFLTTATDLIFRETPTGTQFWTLEYRSALRGAPNTGQLIQYDTPVGRVIATGLQGPTGLAQDPATGDIFVAENAGGRITRVRLR